MAELTQNEKRLLAVLEKEKKADAPHIAGLLGATPEAVVQWGHLLEDKGLAAVERIVVKEFTFTDEGKTYAQNGLPETQLLRFILPGTQLADLQKHEAFRIGFGQLRKKKLITVVGTQVSKVPGASTDEDESALKNPDATSPRTKELIRRGILQECETVRNVIAITPTGLELAKKGLDLREETGTLTREMILSGSWKTANLRRYDVTKLPKKTCPGKIHPYQRIIQEMREILLDMGFEELYGDIVQQSFWNFDALFQPQDHPAREMQDTFYLRETLPLPPGWEKVKAMHLSGGETSSTGWGGTWKEEKAEQCVLRTHTTSLSIQHLARNRNPPVKAFAVGRVYRRETIDTTHLAEFEQLEGIVMDEDVSFANLLGILREFYNRMGFTSVRFKPSYYPYTEPSLDAEVYIDGIGWIEMGGAGVFREEVTAPIGISYPVLAWGLGVSRIAMLRLGLKDLRLLHKSDVAFLRETPSLRRARGGI
ncbi:MULTISPECIES: phenylalanine--tRNA ligase subunit alpha [unclassified Methanoregula]|uniref:phenylalanine--tRNA ligase subunit alpha n=1 Tax=unclassified Methanoregula TaxID=2649730 RepID=UPI0009C88362|nr:MULTISPECIES: phenylalanine--tRNA ligase subunit alpha [unclassified Methanoregula]OPX61957.1 MAG: Phenylalanine--tRNA ligase alpha subunit [Methanoregula sp. PtaB.Bin085]OPY34368.1 MAG: Phenylalanine--tRNA ligase alpha subunit [Methanoregula sp. PtaU1.Bin006]